jgi:hypothetical protein
VRCKACGAHYEIFGRSVAQRAAVS